MVRDVGILFARPEEQHIEAHRIFCRGLGNCPLRPCLARQHLLIDRRRIAIADHTIRNITSAICGCGASGAPSIHGDPLDIHTKLDIDAGALEKSVQFLDKLAGATHAEEHAPAPLQIMDQRIDRGGCERIAADKQRMNRKGLAKQRMLDMSVHKAGDGVITAKAQQRGHLRHHCHESGKRLVGEFFEPNLENLTGCLKQSCIAGHITWRETFDLGVGILDRGAVVELVAVVKMKTVPGIEWPEVEMILAALSEQLEQFVEQEWCCDHCRASIMPKATPFKHLRTPANGIQPVDQRHGIAARAHTQGSRNTTEARTDYEHIALPGRPGLGWRGRGILNSRGGWCHNACVRPG